MTLKKTQLGWLALAIVGGFALRAWFIVHSARIEGDSLIYGDIAKNLLTHRVYGFGQTASGPLPTLIRLPGYPLFLAACFAVFGVDHYVAVLWAQAVVDMVTCGLVAGLAARRFGRRGGMASLWLAALCPFTANYVAAPLSETLTLFCVALAFFGLERWKAAGAEWNRWVWVIGAALGYALLLRPEQGLLAVAVIPAMLWVSWQRSGRKISSLVPIFAAAICVVLPLVPWTVRNWRTFHQFQPLAPRYATDPGEIVPLGFQRWFRTWAVDFASTENVYWNYNSTSIDIGNLPSRAFDNQEQYERTAAILRDYNRDNNATLELDARWESLAQERIKADPIRYYAVLPTARLMNMMLRPRVEMMGISLEWWKWRENRRAAIFGWAYAGLNFIYFALGSVGFWMWWRRGWCGARELACSMMGYVVLRCALLLTIDNSEPRYTLEFFPVLVVWAGALFMTNSRDSSVG